MQFRTAVLAVRASSRMVVVAVASQSPYLAQIFCFDAATFNNVFSALSYQPPPPPASNMTTLFAPVALGPRWLAYAAFQPAPSHVSSTGRASPQHLSPSPGASPSTSPANGSGPGLLAHMVKESGKHLAAGIVSLGDMSFRAASRIYSEHLADGSSTSLSGNGGTLSSSGASAGGALSPRPGATAGTEDCAGMVTVRDVVSQGRIVVAQFRAHKSPLLWLSFDPTGTLLVTASVCGHTLNVFRLIPPSTANGGAGNDPSNAHVHLYKLHRGVTSAVIQNVSFSSDSHWIALSTTRGTTHLFAISPFGGPVGPHTHGAISGFSSDVDSIPQGLPITVQPSVPWWANQSAVRSSQQQAAGPPQAINLTVVHRVKNHKGGWKGSVAGAAAAATGRANTIVGAVAAMFHDGGGATQMQLRTQDGREVGVGTLRQQLYVLSPSGTLLRYLLAPYVGSDNNGGPGPGVASSGFVNGSPGMVFSGSLSSSPGNALGMSPGGMGAGLYGMSGLSPGSGGAGAWTEPSLKLYVEPFEKWEVCRKVFWGEREERVDSIGTQNRTGAQHRSADGGGLPGGAAGNEGQVPESLQRWYMSHAEVRTHQSLEPLWANPRVHFQVLQPGTATGYGDTGGVEGDGLGVAVEEIPTKRVLVRQKDLVPLREKLEQSSLGSSQGLHTPRDPALETPSSETLSLQDSPRGTGMYATQGTGAFSPMRPSTSRVKRPSSGSSNSSGDSHAGLLVGSSAVDSHSGLLLESSDGHSGLLMGGHVGWNAPSHGSGEGPLHATAMTPTRLPLARNLPPPQQGSEVLLLERPSSHDDRLHNGAVDDMELSVSHMNAPGPEGRLAPTIGPTHDFNSMLDDGRSEDQSSESNTPPSSFESSPSFFHSHQQGLLPAAVYSGGPSRGSDSFGGGYPNLPTPLPPNAIGPSAIIGSPPMAIPRASSQGELRQGFGQSSRSSTQGSGLSLREDAAGPTSGNLVLVAPGHGPSRLGPREVGPADMLGGLPERTSSPDEDVGGVFDFETGSLGPSSHEAHRGIGHGLVGSARSVNASLGLMDRGMRDLGIAGMKGWDGRESGCSLPERESNWTDGGDHKAGQFGGHAHSPVHGVGDLMGGAAVTPHVSLAGDGTQLAHSQGLGIGLSGDAGSLQSGWDRALPDMDPDGDNTADGWEIGDGLFAGGDE